jgi:hypothetical protein
MLAALILSVLTAFGVPELKSEQVVVIVTGIGAIAVYMLAEGAVDKEAVDSGEFDSVKEETDLGE